MKSTSYIGLEHSHSPGKFPHAPFQAISTIPVPPNLCSDICHRHLVGPLLELYIKKSLVCILYSLASFIQHNVFEIQLCY